MSEPPQCCICLDGFTSPASLPCGHCFCLACIGDYWRVLGSYQCPLCKTLYPSRPQLKTDQTRAGGEDQEEATVPLKAGEVPCDFCPARHRAVKSCLECMASYCAAHLERHYRSEDLGRHPLISVAKNLEDSVCRLHGRPLNRFCRSDQTCICAMCGRAEHRGHHVVSVNKEAAKRKVKLKRRRAKLQQAIQERLSRVERMEVSADLQNNEELVRQLEEEVSELQRRTGELEQLCVTEDDLRFLQVCVTLESPHKHKHVC